ncbi:MAG: PAS domain S-box protein [Alphaproteobacteria bacterium]|nr:PAS domain S-box protein [Alphaproteobacteria bacterium]
MTRHDSDPSADQTGFDEEFDDGSLLKSIIDAAPDAIITIDVDGLVRSFSPAAERMFGFQAAEVIGRNVNMLMPSPDKERHDGYLARYLRTGEKRIIGIGREINARRKDGEVFSAELAVGELVLGEHRLFTGFIRDVTDRVEAERKADQLQRELAHLNRIQTMGELATALAHELNQPLAAISNYAQAARRVIDAEAADPTKADPAKVSAMLAQVAEQALRAGEIMKRMRGFAQRGEIDRQPEDINGIVREAVRLSLGGLTPRDVDVSFQLADNLPPVGVDRIQIQQVIMNLMRNALDALLVGTHPAVDISTALSHPDKRVQISAAGHDGDQVRVSVRDSGPGIAPEIANRLFDPLATTKKTGLGVGLAICRTIVEAHGGKIWAESTPGEGAAFHFTLPGGE